MKILGMDIGQNKSAWETLDTQTGEITNGWVAMDADALRKLLHHTHRTLHEPFFGYVMASEELAKVVGDGVSVCHGCRGEQVIIQVWISTHFGVLSEQLPVADEKWLFIRGNFVPGRAGVKAIRALFAVDSRPGSGIPSERERKLWVEPTE